MSNLNKIVSFPVINQKEKKLHISHKIRISGKIMHKNTIKKLTHHATFSLNKIKYYIGKYSCSPNLVI